MATKRPALGVIDSLGAGFESINRIIWIIVLPLAVDLFLWLGPPLSMAPVARRFLDWYGQIATGPFAEAAAQGSGVDPVRQALEALGSDFNLFQLLVTSFANVPSAVTTPLSGFSQATQVDSLPVFLALVVGLEVAGALIGCLYLGAIAQQVRSGEVNLGVLGRRVWSYWLNVLGYAGLLLAAGLGAGLVSSLLIAMTALASPALGTALAMLMILVWWSAVFIVLLFTFFLVDAIVVSEVGPWRALINSSRVVSRNMGASVGLIFLLWVIAGGTRVIWDWLPNQTWGTLTAILVNAYIGSGLAAASMTFYKNRVEQLAGAGEQGARRLA